MIPSLLKKVLPMGVVNITPNSFSEKHYTPEEFALRMSYLEQWKVPLVDIGAESTAPCCNPIEALEEKNRFETIFFPWKKKHSTNQIFSIDSYRPETFCHVDDFLQSQKESVTIWNDVSGVVDDDVFHVLKERKHTLYVYCHTSTKDRNLSSHHMKYPLDFPSEILPMIVQKDFLNTYNMFKKKKMENRLILDPGFGFSKTTSQNWALAGDLPSLIKALPEQIPFLVGISRKSFLRNALPSDFHKEQLKLMEYLQVSLIGLWFGQLKKHSIWFRLHDPGVFAMTSLLYEKSQ